MDAINLLSTQLLLADVDNRYQRQLTIDAIDPTVGKKKFKKNENEKYQHRPKVDTNDLL